MAKEFDIYLNNRLTECDIIVYSIPYRDGLTAIHKLILESCIESYTLYKFVAAQTNSELVQHIDEMLKICYERLDYQTNFGVSADFQTHYSLYPDIAGMPISAECVNVLSNMFTQAESTMQLSVEPIMAYTGKSGGHAESSMIIDVGLQHEIKNSLLTIEPGISLQHSILGTEKQSILSVEVNTPIVSELTDLCYRLYNTGQTMVQLASEVLATELHYSLGEGSSHIKIDATVGLGDSSTKYEAFEDAVLILSQVIESIQQFMNPEYNSILFGFDSECILKRHRLLYEMDDDALSAYDDMTLEEIDYVII